MALNRKRVALTILSDKVREVIRSGAARGGDHVLADDIKTFPAHLHPNKGKLNAISTPRIKNQRRFPERGKRGLRPMR
jgi:hypothetical protein